MFVEGPRRPAAVQNFRRLARTTGDFEQKVAGKRTIVRIVLDPNIEQDGAVRVFLGGLGGFGSDASSDSVPQLSGVSEKATRLRKRATVTVIEADEFVFRDDDRLVIVDTDEGVRRFEEHFLQ